MRSCGNWLLTVKDLLTLKSVCVLRAPRSAGQLPRLCRLNSPNTCLLFPPSKLPKSKSAQLRRCLWACSEQTQHCLMCDVHYSAVSSTERQSSPGPRGDPVGMLVHRCKGYFSSGIPQSNICICTHTLTYIRKSPHPPRYAVWGHYVISLSAFVLTPPPPNLNQCGPEGPLATVSRLSPPSSSSALQLQS